MYHITITKRVERGGWTDKEWTVLEMEYDDEGREKPRKGYTPQERVIRMVEKKVLEQMVEEMDLARVIAAINGLELK